HPSASDDVRFLHFSGGHDRFTVRGDDQSLKPRIPRRLIVREIHDVLRIADDDRVQEALSHALLKLSEAPFVLLEGESHVVAFSHWLKPPPRLAPLRLPFRKYRDPRRAPRA